MQEPGKILVSMTSYPGRIKNVGMSIFLLLEQQTLPPDEVHLWLAIPQFPNKEADLPEDLQKLIRLSKVKLHWLPKNTYVHKRHEIFKIASPEDCVFLIDDDVMYADDLIETVIDVHHKNPGCIVCYNNYAFHEYKGKRILYRNSTLGPGPHVNKVRWCGQSMIPAAIYPKEILNPIHQAIRDSASPVSDECWMQPWIVLKDIPIYYLSYGWGIDLDPNNGKDKGLVAWSHKKDENGYEKRDNWLNAVLHSYDIMLSKYKELFSYECDIN